MSEVNLAPWHDGEVALQRRVGVDQQMAAVGKRVFRDHLDAQHQAFYPELPFAAVGVVDAAGDAWATLLAGRPGFLSTALHEMHVAAARDPNDPADAGMNDRDAIALLGIQLETRRRNRMNGRIRRSGPDGFDLVVGQAFGNCPQYIQLRGHGFAREPGTGASAPARVSDALDTETSAMIRTADTFFVASYVDREGGQRQVDVSHRGGRPGFVRIGDDGVLTIPDFAGNLYFNTLGNLLVNPRAGLLFVDFGSGDTLQLTGDAEIVLESPEIAAFQGAERLWRFRPRRVVLRRNALPLRWSFETTGWSPNTLMTGDWKQAASRLKAAELALQWRPLKVRQIVDESPAIRSFHLTPADDAGLVPHLPGQHLPIRVSLPGEARPALRTYTLSSAPSDADYRISVKRDGKVSRWLHDHLKVGDTLEARHPAGSFTIDARASRPAVLLAAGVGVTPLIAMLRHLVYEGLRTRYLRPATLFYAVRTAADRAFDGELAGLLRLAQGLVRVVRVVSEATGGVSGKDYEILGRLDAKLVGSAVADLDQDYYLCGPPGFMQSLYDGLRAAGVPNARLHAEAFGPTALLRDTPRPAEAREPAQEPVAVAFLTSSKEARWTPGCGSLLDLAEARGLAPDASCRGGSCGTCRTRVVSGAVAYATLPSAAVGEDEALICCAVPAAPRPGEASSLQLEL